MFKNSYKLSTTTKLSQIQQEFKAKQARKHKYLYIKRVLA